MKLRKISVCLRITFGIQAKNKEAKPAHPTERLYCILAVSGIQQILERHKY
jgi:hypothetical protein